MKTKNLLPGILIAIVASASGCASATFTKTGDYTAKPRDPNCDFAVYTTPPTESFKELGVVDFITFVNSVASVDDAKRDAKKFVCRAGGNGLILAKPFLKGAYSAEIGRAHV